MGCSMELGLASAPRCQASAPTMVVANRPRTSMTCAMLMDSDRYFVNASLTVKPTMATTMSSAPRRFGDRGTTRFQLGIVASLYQQRQKPQHQSAGPRRVPFFIRLPVPVSAAGDAHVSRHRRSLRATVDDEVVPFWLAADGLVYRRRQKFVAFGGTQRRAQIGGTLLAKA